jgi:carboxyl-terminal processing protease
MRSHRLSLFSIVAAFVLLVTPLAPSAQPALPAAAPIDADAAAIIDKHIAAIGGQALRQSTAFVDTVTETERSGSIEKGRRVDDFRDPMRRRFYSVQDGASGKIETGFDGTRAWRRAPFFRGYLEDSDTTTRAAKQPRQELGDYMRNGMTLKKLADETIDGKNYLVIVSTITTLGGATPMKYFFDPATYLLMRTEQGEAIKVVTLFGDYRSVQGRKVAFTRTLQTPQISMLTRTISVTYSDAIDESLFQYAQEKSAEKTTTVDKAVVTTSSRDADAAMDTATKQASFQLAWKTINDSYWDQNFHGVNWQKIREKYAPLVMADHTNKSFHALLNQMLGELGRSHLRITPPHLVSTLTTTTAEQSKNGTPGIDMRLIDNELVVVKIDDGSDAAKVVRIGDVIESINGKTPAELLAKYRLDNTGFVGSEASGTVRAARGAFVGPIDEKANVMIRNHQDTKRNILLTRKKVDVSRSLDFETKFISPQIGYIRFNYFLGDLATKFSAAISTYKNTSGLIVDLRGNGGGIGDLSTALATMLVVNKGTLGESRFRYETRQFSYAGSADAYMGKVIFLVDEFSASTSEVLTGGLQYAKRITVLGERSAGAVLPSLMTVLPSGGAMQYAISDFRLPNQQLLEGQGVLPDETIKLKRIDVIAGRDMVLARAIVLLT